jgi:hypothetical protein
VRLIVTTYCSTGQPFAAALPRHPHRPCRVCKPIAPVLMRIKMADTMSLASEQAEGSRGDMAPEFPV